MDKDRVRMLLQQALAEIDASSPPAPPVPTPQPPAPQPAPPPAGGGSGCDGFSSPLNIEMAWPSGANNVKRCPPGWTPDRPAVIHFKAGTTVGDTAIFQFSHAGPPYWMMIASVSNAAGCNVCRDYPPKAPILAASGSQTPSFRFVVGTTRAGFISVYPGADYWITAVWAHGFGRDFLPSGQPGVDGGAGIRFDFNT